jgi:mevalonate kinase
MFVWSGSAWVSVATEVESLATYATQSYADNQPGMKLIVPSSVSVGSGTGSVATQGTVTFSGASSVSINGAFTSAYENYKLLITISSTSANDAEVRIRLRASGTDTTSANYNHANYAFRSNNTANNYGAAGLTNMPFGQIESAFSANANYFYNIDISQPQLAVNTKIVYTGQDTDGSSNYVSRGGGGLLNLTTQYDGITFYNDNASGTLTGTARVYGYKIG